MIRQHRRRRAMTTAGPLCQTPGARSRSNRIRTDVALLLPFFKKRVWWEAGATLDGKIQAMAMFNF